MLEDCPLKGAGLSFRQELKEGILAAPHRVDLLELISDQYIDKSPLKEKEAESLARDFPIVLHGVELSIGTDCQINDEYLKKLHRLADAVNPLWVSDHLCFTGVPGSNLAQLTPIAFTERMVKTVSRKIKQVAATFDCPFLLENISYYFLVPPSEMSEAEFITNVVHESDCWLLLDLANLLNNATNHQYDPFEFLDRIPLERVVQIHLAGGSYKKNLLLDTHSHPIHAEEFDMLRYAAPRMPMLRGVIIERDQNFPPIEELFAEVDSIRDCLANHWMPHHATKCDAASAHLVAPPAA